MVCLSFATQLNLETLRKVQIEGAALQVIHTILTQIVNTPNRVNFRLTSDNAYGKIGQELQIGSSHLRPIIITINSSICKFWTWSHR